MDFLILDVPFQLYIWDTAGQDRVFAANDSYYRNSDVVLMAFDMGSPDSLGEVRVFWSHLQSVLHDPSAVPVRLCVAQWRHVAVNAAGLIKVLPGGAAARCSWSG